MVFVYLITLGFILYRNVPTTISIRHAYRYQQNGVNNVNSVMILKNYTRKQILGDTVAFMAGAGAAKLSFYTSRFIKEWERNKTIEESLKLIENTMI